MMTFYRSPQGLKFVCTDSDLTAIEILTCLLDSANVQYVKGQVSGNEVFFKVEPSDQPRIENMIQGWMTTISDIQFALSHAITRK